MLEFHCAQPLPVGVGGAVPSAFALGAIPFKVKSVQNFSLVVSPYLMFSSVKIAFFCIIWRGNVNVS